MGTILDGLGMRYLNYKQKWGLDFVVAMNRKRKSNKYLYAQVYVKEIWRK